MTDAKSTASEAKQQIDAAQAHTSYQLSMVAEELVGVTNLDKPNDIINPTTHESVGSLSLCMVLLNYLKMQDGLHYHARERDSVITFLEGKKR